MVTTYFRFNYYVFYCQPIVNYFCLHSVPHILCSQILFAASVKYVPLGNSLIDSFMAITDNFTLLAEAVLFHSSIVYDGITIFVSLFTKTS